jgi:EAL domain-containing protein (putative c-di-GMP-specific phosphodiesterase class I)
MLPAPAATAERPGQPRRWAARARGDSWLRRLRHALDEDLFELHFQPILRLHDDAVCHHEALVRLADRPGGPLIAPAGFLPAAERLGLIRELDRMVLAKVASLLGSGRHLDGAIAVNLSAVSVADGGMPATLERTLSAHGADASRLIVEITETSAITDMDRARTFCARAQALGCSVSLDDFGSGWGSFRYLKHLPFSYLKIDGEFIRGLVASRTDQLVVRALVGVVRGMGRRTVAEFVGDRPTLELLRTLGVDYAQGFQVGEPAPLAGS